MTSNVVQGLVDTVLLASASAANTAAATSAWVDVRAYEGPLKFTINTGIITGTCTWTIEDATDGSGTGAATVTPNEGAFTAVTTSNDPILESRTVPKTKVRGWVRVVGTIVTGPALCAASLQATPKYIG